LAVLSRNSSAVPKLEDYKDWLITARGVRPALVEEQFYESNAKSALDQFSSDAFWISLIGCLKDINSQYLIEKKDFLISDFSPNLVHKPYGSFLEKTYRKNILSNPNWPDPPPEGWILPSNWFSKIGDIIRSTIIVRYLDGVTFLSKKVSDIAASVGTPCLQEYEGRIDGYYALHLSYQKDIVLIDGDWNSLISEMRLEIQITTEIKQLVKALLHIFYEKSRLSHDQGESSWIWDYKSDQFSANNLGHMVHYIEGMLVQIRDRQVM